MRRLNDTLPEGMKAQAAVLQEVKESLYYYNEEQIAREIQNYLFAINFETGMAVTCTYTGSQAQYMRVELADGSRVVLQYRLATVELSKS